MWMREAPLPSPSNTILCTHSWMMQDKHWPVGHIPGTMAMHMHSQISQARIHTTLGFCGKVKKANKQSHHAYAKANTLVPKLATSVCALRMR